MRRGLGRDERDTRAEAPSDRPTPPGARRSAAPKVVPDPKWLWQMQVKLIDAEIEHLEVIDKRIRKQGSKGAPRTRAEFSPRFFAEASRDLQRAVDWYRKLEEEGL